MKNKITGIITTNSISIRKRKKYFNKILRGKQKQKAAAKGAIVVNAPWAELFHKKGGMQEIKWAEKFQF